jgi:hypothetical protein
MGTSARDGAPRRLTPAPAQSAAQTAFLFATVECAAPLGAMTQPQGETGLLWCHCPLSQPQEPRHSEPQATVTRKERKFRETSLFFY